MFGSAPQLKRKVGRPRGPHWAALRRNEKIIADRVAGVPVADLCKKYNLCANSIYRITGNLPAPAEPALSERNMAITLAYENGDNSTALAEKHGVSRERICQILRRTNTIEHRAERRRAEREAFAEEAARITAAHKEELQKKLEQAVDLVRQGKSLANAAFIVGLSKNHTKLLGKECKRLGVETKWGRFIDRAPKIARCRDLRAQGLKWTEISKICDAEGLGQVNPVWVSYAMPDLVQRRGEKREKEIKTAEPENCEPKVRPPRAEEFVWTPESVAKLIELWFSGASAQQCVDVLGAPLTSNSIIGKINRLRAAGELKRPEPQ